jgi:hypothetical protein
MATGGTGARTANFGSTFLGNWSRWFYPRVSLSPDREQIERRFLQSWTLGYNPTLESVIADHRVQ